jgi:YHS domain-containing protein
MKTLLALLAGSALIAGVAAAAPPAAKPGLVCPVLKSPIADKSKAPHMLVNNEPVYFCCGGCDAKLKAEPSKYLTSLKDPVTGKSFKLTPKTPKVEQAGGLFLFSSDQTKTTFLKDPAKYSKPHEG